MQCSCKLCRGNLHLPVMFLRGLGPLASGLGLTIERARAEAKAPRGGESRTKVFCQNSLLAATALRMEESRFVLIITAMDAVGRSRTAVVKRGYTYVPVAGRAATRLLIAPRRSDYLLKP